MKFSVCFFIRLLNSFYVFDDIQCRNEVYVNLCCVPDKAPDSLVHTL